MASTTLPQTAPTLASARVAERGGVLRTIPIRWRILSIAILNTLAVLVVAAVVWDGARTLSGAWDDLNAARNADRLLISINSDIGRVQSQIHRYFTQPNQAVLDEIDRRRGELLQRLYWMGATGTSRTMDLVELSDTTQRFFAGFDELKNARAGIVKTYEQEVLRPAREMAGLYGIIDSATANSSSFIWPALGRSREAFNSALVAANAFYLSQELKAAYDTRESIGVIERTVPFMLDLSENDLQKNALQALGRRAAAFMAGFNRLASGFTAQNELLKTAIDDNQAAMAAAIDRLSGMVRNAEEATQARFDQALRSVYERVALAGLAFMAVSILIGIGTARSISAPLDELKLAMQDIVDGDYQRRVHDLKARDEVGDMARAVDVFRKNAIAKKRAEDELRAAKDHAEATLMELRDAQQNLIETEKFAALGSLVAGVAHEVNNPVGISLTVASSLARRCEAFELEVASGAVRRSSLSEFVAGNKDAANQLVANLQRAGELVQSFKQVAVDRSHAERRSFDLAETTHQIVASLLPGAKKRHIGLEVDVPPGIVLDSYPGPYGQVLTNLFLNAATHAYDEGAAGTVSFSARRLAGHNVEIVFQDDGCGMAEEVLRRVFEPFFTTRRGDGGTGLGLHIVYNLVTHRLGGRIGVESALGRGTRFRIVLPLVAPRDDLAVPATRDA
jgi:signal transduction histidine kinase